MNMVRQKLLAAVVDHDGKSLMHIQETDRALHIGKSKPYAATSVRRQLDGQR
jgi:hypothetical protein